MRPAPIFSATPSPANDPIPPHHHQPQREDTVASFALLGCSTQDAIYDGQEELDNLVWDKNEEDSEKSLKQMRLKQRVAG